MISLSDVRLGTVNSNVIENKLKSISSKIISNESHNKEELDKSE